MLFDMHVFMAKYMNMHLTINQTGLTIKHAGSFGVRQTGITAWISRGKSMYVIPTLASILNLA